MVVSSANGKCGNEIQEVGETTAQTQTSRRGLLDERKHWNWYIYFLKAFPKRSKYLKLGPSPSAKFWQFAEEKDEVSRAVPSSPDHHRTPSSSSSSRFGIPFMKKIDWASLWQLSKSWIRNPVNIALFIWILFVAISGAILFMVMTGMLNGVLPRKSQRDGWFEVNNQILNALFTLMCLYQHPKRFYHLVLLIRWRKAEDVLKLRKVYCKNGVYKPNEWVHIMVVVFLLNLNCFAQYALCGLNLGYPRSKRPAIGVGVCISVAIGAPAFAAVYNMLSPIGKDYETDIDEEAQTLEDTSVVHRRLERRYSFAVQGNTRVPESNPQWMGGIYDLWDDLSLAYLSVFCSCCVFGWNMEKLGFGNMYVHVMTFFLFCIAPFFIFNLAAVNINDEVAREALGIAGILLCVFGLLYGGFWRIQMRKRFGLPSYTFCCGKPSVTDCFLWLCCCSCALAQEVRTADYYDIVQDTFFLKQTGDPISPLPREDALHPLYRSDPSSSNLGNYRESSTPTRSPSRFSTPGSPSSPYRGSSSSAEVLRESSTPTRSPGRFAMGSPLPVVEEEDESLKGSIEVMKPPVSPVIQREAGPIP